MDSKRIAQVLEEMGTLLELGGENPFRCRAYHAAARSVEGLPRSVESMIADGSLKEVSGIGETMFKKIAQLATTGRLAEYEELKRKTPPGLTALLRVPGLGPKKIKLLREQLGIEGLADLKAAAQAGKIGGLKGFGARTEAKILEGIAFVESVGERILLARADELIGPVLQAVRAHPAVIRAEACGSLRRRAETCGDLDIVFSSTDPATVLAAFTTLPQVETVLAQGPTRASVRLSGGVQCDLRGVSEPEYPCALHYFTGSKQHNIAIRRRANERGWSLNEYALTSENGPIPCRDEAELFARLGLSFIPPELREDHGEIEAAEAGTLPHLITRSDLKGTFHCHTTWSDGAAELAEMAAAARQRGLHYLGIADHSRSARYANGLDVDRVLAQAKEIDRLNAAWSPSFRLFKGIECDILADGSLDFPDEVLDGFDYVVASVHTHFQQSEAEMTARLVRAASNPRVTMMGHLTGRLLLAREGYAVDVAAVIKAAAQSGVMIEINANPHRLDLDSTWSRRARAEGVMLVINPDAHSVDGLDDLNYGIDVARRAWLTRADVWNTHTLKHVAQQLEERKRNRPT